MGAVIEMLTPNALRQDGSLPGSSSQKLVFRAPPKRSGDTPANDSCEQKSRRPVRFDRTLWEGGRQSVKGGSLQGTRGSDGATGFPRF